MCGLFFQCKTSWRAERRASLGLGLPHGNMKEEDLCFYVLLYTSSPPNNSESQTFVLFNVWKGFKLLSFIPGRKYCNFYLGYRLYRWEHFIISSITKDIIWHSYIFEVLLNAIFTNYQTVFYRNISPNLQSHNKSYIFFIFTERSSSLIYRLIEFRLFGDWK